MTPITDEQWAAYRILVREQAVHESTIAGDNPILKEFDGLQAAGLAELKDGWWAALRPKVYDPSDFDEPYDD